MRAIGCPGTTWSPTSSSSASTVPATGEGISALTLSVCASISVSPSSTWSPRCLLHAPTVISSAPCRSGITTSWTSTLMPSLSSCHRHHVEEVLFPVVEPAFRHEQHAARLQSLDELGVVAHDHHRPRPCRQGRRHAPARRWIQVVRRLVQEQQVVL